MPIRQNEVRADSVNRRVMLRYSSNAEQIIYYGLFAVPQLSLLSLDELERLLSPDLRNIFSFRIRQTRSTR